MLWRARHARFCRSSRQEIANEKNAKKLNKFSYALNRATDKQCRFNREQCRAQQQQPAGDDASDGFEYRIMSCEMAGDQQEPKAGALVIDKPGDIVNLSAPGAIKWRA